MAVHVDYVSIREVIEGCLQDATFCWRRRSREVWFRPRLAFFLLTSALHHLSAVPLTFTGGLVPLMLNMFLIQIPQVQVLLLYKYYLSREALPAVDSGPYSASRRTCSLCPTGPSWKKRILKIAFWEARMKSVLKWTTRIGKRGLLTALQERKVISSSFSDVDRIFCHLSNEYIPKKRF